MTAVMEHFSRATRIARRAIESDVGLPPILTTINAQGGYGIIVLPVIPSPEEAPAVQELVKSKNPVAIIFTADANITLINPNSGTTEHFEAVEILLVEKGGIKRTLQMRYHREGDRVVWDTETDSDGSMMMGGRIHSLLMGCL